MNHPKQPTDFVSHSERISCGQSRSTNDLPPAWFGYIILGLFVGFLLGTSFTLFL